MNTTNGQEPPQTAKEVPPALPVRTCSPNPQAAYCNIVDANGAPLALGVPKSQAPYLVQAINGSAIVDELAQVCEMAMNFANWQHTLDETQRACTNDELLVAATTAFLKLRGEEPNADRTR